MIKCNRASSRAALMGLVLVAGAAAVAMGHGRSQTQAVSGAAGQGVGGDPWAGVLQNSIVLPAVIRDFKAAGERGHADFQAYGNPVITTGLVEDRLDRNGKPVFKGRRGQQIDREFRNQAGQPIHPMFFGVGLRNRPADANQAAAQVGQGRSDAGGSAAVSEQRTAVSDSRGSMSQSSNQLTSAERFAEWYADVPGVNVSSLVNLTFNRVAGTNRYVFDSAADEPWRSRGGFFPINGMGFGNYGSWGKNFHFTTELMTEFVYDQGSRQSFTFSGDDDVWVFIDGRLLMDLGGLHPRREQTLELDRVDFLEHGKSHKLTVFHAERATNESNFRIETTITLRRADLPNVTGMFD